MAPVGVEHHAEVAAQRGGGRVDREGALEVVLAQIVLLLAKIDRPKAVPTVDSKRGGFPTYRGPRRIMNRIIIGDM